MYNKKGASASVRSVLSYIRGEAGVPAEVRHQIAKLQLVEFIVNLNAGAHCCSNVD